MRKPLFILFILLLGTLVPAVAQQADFNLNSRRISVQDGLSGNTINELVQDEEGFIWMATNNGLTRYDGYATVNYTSLSGDPKHPLEARIGRIVSDSHSHLLWMRTATYMNACYDLPASRFVDWTGVGEQHRQYNKFFLSPSGRGMFFYGNSQGVRRSEHDGTGFRLTDYNSRSGSLPSDDVLLLLEDSARNVLMPTAGGLVLLPPDGAPRTLLQGMSFLSAATDGRHTYLFSDKGEAVAIDTEGRETMRSQLPSALGAIAKVNVSFVWQGQWLLFTPQGTYSLDLATGRFERPQGYQLHGGLDQGQCPGYHFVADAGGRLLIFPERGEPRQMELIPNARFASNRGRKFHIAPDREGRLFIATYGNGLFVWTPQTGQLRHFTAEDPNPVIRTNYLLYALCDREGCIWIGSEATGAYCLSVMTGNTMNYVLPEPRHQGDWANAVSALAQRRDGTIIIGTREGGIYYYDQESGVVTKRDERQSNVTGSLVDRDGHLWISTHGEGLFYNGQQYQKGDARHPLPENRVDVMCQDVRGRIWIGTWDGGLLMTSRPREGEPLRFRQFLTGSMNESRIKALALDSAGTLYVGTNNGLYLLDTREETIADLSFRVYNTSNGRFAHDEIFSLHLSAEGTLWVGAAGSGVVKCRFGKDGSLQTDYVTTREGLANNNVYSIVEDDYGFLWVGTEEGISRINTRNNIVFTYQPSPVIQGNVATERCAIRTRDGRLLFGTNYGVMVIAPSPADHGKDRLSQASITDLHINGTSVFESDELRLKGAGPLRLAHTQNTLSFFFSDFSYNNTQSSLYQYYLEGAETTWCPMTTEHRADYAELRPGTYVFHLRSLSSANEWQAETAFTVVIRQPWYNTWWAWLLYLLAGALLAVYVYRNWKEKFDLHQQVKLERQLMDFRVRFFTHITHEFRTPLAIIKGAIDKLAAQPDDRQALQTARRGTRRLLKLVGQFLEFRKASTGKLRLRVAEADIVAFVRNICQDFWPMANQKDQQLVLLPAEREMRVPFDAGMVETIVYNLLSNAVKYTPQGGNVTLRIKWLSVERLAMRDVTPSATEVKSLNSQPLTLNIIIEDSGPGISPQQQQVLFQPFMQGLASQGGMGIGLYTAHELARVHHGTLSYEPAGLVPGQTGSRFTLTLPAEASAYAADEWADAATSADTAAPASTDYEEPIRQIQPDPLNEHRVAVIEDDPDMMEQLRTELGVYFRIDSYMDGRQGLEGVQCQRPSLLVCDVMLPGLDGFEVVSRLKAQPDTAAIPVILLTALADEDYQLRAYKAGADDFMVKPCNFRLLIARAIQLMQSVPVTQPPARPEDACSQQDTKTPAPQSPLLTSHADKLFLERLSLLVGQHLSEEDFGIDQLAQMMSMGRTKFYGRVKELTSLSPNKYLMQARMQRAAELLSEGELTVAEVSYRVGIQDPSYFNKCFKAQFGVTPSRYGK